MHQLHALWRVTTALALSWLAVCLLLPLGALALHFEWAALQEQLSRPWIQRVILFSLWQASLSTLLALVLALPLAWALVETPRFAGRSMLLTLLGLALVLPTVVAVHGLIVVYGRNGWFNQLLALFDQHTSLYGLGGILLAHVYFNLPLATRVILPALHAMPIEHGRIGAQLNFGPWQRLRFLHWPLMRRQLPGLALLIFALCFSSFATVLMLGGGPRATTIEVAIYQALRFDFDLPAALALALIQLVLSALLLLPMGLRQDHTASQFAWHEQRDVNAYLPAMRPRLAFALIIGLAALFIALPLLALLINALNAEIMAVLRHPDTLRALRNTLLAGTAAGLLAVTVTLPLLISARHLHWRRGQTRLARALHLSGNLVLVLPPTVLGTGLFLLLRPHVDVFALALVLVIIINALFALPFALRVLEGPVMQGDAQQDRLLRSLDVRGLDRWRVFDWPRLRRPIGLALGLGAALSAGDLGAIALFGSDRVMTLSLLLYQRTGSYRLEEASVTALLLLLCCLLLFQGAQLLLNTRRNSDEQT